jgi:hypothetical protein
MAKLNRASCYKSNLMKSQSTQRWICTAAGACWAVWITTAKRSPESFRGCGKGGGRFTSPWKPER